MQYSLSKENDSPEIAALFERVFTDSEGADEGKLIGKLAADMLETKEEEALYCFVARDEDTLTGCIMLSRLTFDGGEEGYILSPVAVNTDYQGKGIGQALINHAKQFLKQKGVNLLTTYGDPAYYCKVGFQQVGTDVISAPLPLSYPHGWLAQSLITDTVAPVIGQSHCIEALNNPDYW